MEQVLKVSSVEDKFSAKNGKPYWTITWGDGTKDSVVSPVFHKAICEAKNSGKSVKINKEQKGNYMTVTSVEIVDGQPTPPTTTYTPTPATNKPNTEDKNRGVSLSYAKDLVVSGKIELDDMLTFAEIFNRYLSGALVIEDMKILENIMVLTRVKSGK